MRFYHKISIVAFISLFLSALSIIIVFNITRVLKCEGLGCIIPILFGYILSLVVNIISFNIVLFKLFSFKGKDLIVSVVSPIILIIITFLSLSYFSQTSEYTVINMSLFIYTVFIIIFFRKRYKHLLIHLLLFVLLIVIPILSMLIRPLVQLLFLTGIIKSPTL